MKIIKQGDLKCLEKIRRFECPDCGCIWEANAAEYRKEWDRNETLVVCECPTCRKSVYGEEPYES